MNMTVSEAAEFLRRYNEWRRGSETDQPCPISAGTAIDTLIAFARGEIKRDEEAHF